MYVRVKSLLLGLLVLLVFGAAWSSPRAATPVIGMPLMQRFGPEDYAAAPVHFGVVANDDGSIYVANVEGVLRYDGTQWTRVALPGDLRARSLVRGHDGRIYVGSYDQFGYIEESDTGKRTYHDLRPRFGLSGDENHLGNIWSIIVADDAVYFRADERLLRLGNDGITQSWPIPPEARGFHAVGTTIYARLNGTGLVRFDDGRYTLIPGGEKFAERALNALFPRDGGLLLIGPEGFYQADDRGIRLLPGAAQKVFSETPPYVAIELPDGDIVAGTYDGHLLHFSRDLNFIARVPLGPYTILALGRDIEGGLWAATEGDLVRVRIPSEWSVYTASDGIPGTISDSAWFDGTLWIANSRGIARATREPGGRLKFDQVFNTTLEAYDLEADDSGMLIAEREGLLWWPKGASQPKRVLDNTTTYFILRSRHDPDALFVGSDKALLRMSRDGTGWKEAARWPLGDTSLTSIQETEDGTLWLGDSRGGLQRWSLDETGLKVLAQDSFGPEQGLDFDPDFGTSALMLDEQVIATTGNRAYAFDGQRFVPYKDGPVGMVSRVSELDIVDTPTGTFATTSRDLLHRAKGSEKWERVHLGSRLARGFFNAHTDEDGSVRVVTWNSLLQYNPGGGEAPDRPLKVSLRHVEYRDPKGQSTDLPLDPDNPQEFDAGGTLRLRFALITMEPGAELRWRLLRRVDQWGEYSAVNDASITFGPMDAGDYQLEVEGRLPSGRKVEPLKMRILVRPAWYQSNLAIAVGLLLLIASIIGIAQLVSMIRYRQFVAINRRLEGKIAERTQELEDANARLAEMATEDSLTGVANRRAMEQALAREWQRCGEQGTPLSVIMVDVDHFKQFNDRHGHLEGDKRLRWVAEQLAEQTRPVRELLARFGGEEFVMILPGFDLDRATQRAERLRQRFNQPDSDVTVSLGVATEIPSPGRDPAGLMQRADTALYTAKHRGRNRVVCAED